MYLVTCHEECMDRQYLMTVVPRAGVPYDSEPRIQSGLHQVRFFHQATDRSLNLGYRSTKDVFVADFVFKSRDTLAQNQADLTAFLRLFGGQVGKRQTPFARLEPAFAQEAWLIDVIRAYWAMGVPLPTAEAFQSDGLFASGGARQVGTASHAQT